MNKKLHRYILFSFLLSLLSHFALAQDPIKVGVILPLSGPLADYGIAVRNGMALAIEEIPQSSNVKLLFEDSQWDPKKAVAAFQKFATIDHVSLVFDWGSATSCALAPIAEREKKVLVSASVDPHVSRNRKWVLRFLSSTESYGQTLLTVLRQRKLTNIAILKTDSLYYEGIYESMRRGKQSNESLKVLGAFPQSEMEFAGYIAKLRAEPPDILAVFLFPGQISRFYRQAAQAKLRLTTIGTDFFESASEVRDAGGAINGAWYINFAAREDFRARYLARFGSDTQVAFAGNAYDFVLALSRIIVPRDGITVATFKKMAPLEGILGKYRWTESEERGCALETPLVLKRIVDGKFEMGNEMNDKRPEER